MVGLICVDVKNSLHLSNSSCVPNAPRMIQEFMYKIFLFMRSSKYLLRRYESGPMFLGPDLYSKSLLYLLLGM